MRPLVVTEKGAVRIISGMRHIGETIDAVGEAEAVDVSTGETVSIRANAAGDYRARPKADEPSPGWPEESAA